MAKKSFQPALQFISTAGTEHSDNHEKQTSKPRSIHKLNTEARTRRVQLLMQPSLYESVKQQAKEEGLSVNDYIHNRLAELINVLKTQ